MGRDWLPLVYNTNSWRFFVASGRLTVPFPGFQHCQISSAPRVGFTLFVLHIFGFYNRNALYILWPFFFQSSSAILLSSANAVCLPACMLQFDWLREVFPEIASKNSNSGRSNCKLILMRPLWSLSAALRPAVVEIMRTLCLQLAGMFFIHIL